MIKVITNSLGSCDWIKVVDGEEQVIYEGHSIGHFELFTILQTLDIPVELVEVDDDEI